MLDGIVAFQEQRYADALDHFASAHADNATAAYYRGLCKLRLGQYQEAANELEPLRGQKGVPAALDFDLSIAMIEAGRTSEGMQLLEGYVAANPENSAAKTQLDEALQRQATARSRPPVSPQSAAPAGCVAFDDVMSDPEASPLRLTFLTGYLYDSNIVLAPEFSGLGSNINRNDSSWVFALFGDYALVQEEDLVIGLIGSVFQSVQFNLDEFNATNLVGGFYANKAVDSFIFGVNYQYNYTALQGDKFLGDNRLVLNGSYLEDDFGHTTVYYEYDHNDFNTPALLPAQRRTADVNAVGVTQAVYLFEGTGRFFAGYRFGVADAEGSDFDFDSHMVTARIELPIESSWSVLANTLFDAEIRYFFDRYDNPNSLDFFDRVRADDRLEVRSGLQKYVDENISIRLDYTYVNSESNVANLFDVEFYSYDRHTVLTQFIYDF